MLFDLPEHDVLYKALCDRNGDYEGSVWVCVKTTGIFCRLTCPARKPKSENCLFYETIGECIGNGFRPCRRCNPMAPEATADKTVQLLLKKLEAAPDKRWQESDIINLGLDPTTVRRAFKRHYGMTFLQMARQTRLREGISELVNGKRVIDAQTVAEYASASAFRAAFTKLTGLKPKDFTNDAPLKVSWIDTPLGAMVIVCDQQQLHLLEFTNRKALRTELNRLQEIHNYIPAPLGFGETVVTEQVRYELNNFFDRRCAEFTISVAMHSTPFTTKVWHALQKIPAGETRSYSDIARAVGKPAAVRAVARANGANPVAIIVPCHRVIGADGSLTGYGGGLWRKQKLIELEKYYAGGKP